MQHLQKTGGGGPRLAHPTRMRILSPPTAEEPTHGSDHVEKDASPVPLLARSFHSLHQECFTTLLQSTASPLFLKTAGVSPYNSHSGKLPISLRLPIVTSLPPFIVACRSRWTSSPWQAIISLRRHRRGWRPSPRRGNEHFSKRTESAGVLSLRICGHTALDRDSFWRGHRRSGRSRLRRIFHANPAEPGSRQAAGPEQNSHRAARSGQRAPRRPERPPRSHRAESRHDPGGNLQGPEPRRIHPQGAADRRPETDRAALTGAKGK